MQMQLTPADIDSLHIGQKVTYKTGGDQNCVHAIGVVADKPKGTVVKIRLQKIIFLGRLARVRKGQKITAYRDQLFTYLIPGLEIVTRFGVTNDAFNPSLPYLLEVETGPVSRRQLAFHFMNELETDLTVARANSLTAINEFIAQEGFQSHPGLISLTITGPKGKIVKKTK